ncbi:MAG: signal peptidase II [Candidatus Omnitrophica bacterium]|nr:signal peptidase II [Candidatus Omnitrophota bacterium]
MIFAVSLSAAAIVFLDQLSKFLILKYLALNKSYCLVQGIFYITPTLNTGGGFGILPGKAVVFTIASIIAIIFIIYALVKHKVKGRIFTIAISLVLSGALGNLIDRLRFGAVLDSLDFRVWPVFNIADSSITIGVVLLAYLVLFKSKART